MRTVPSIVALKQCLRLDGAMRAERWDTVGGFCEGGKQIENSLILRCHSPRKRVQGADPEQGGRLPYRRP